MTKTIAATALAVTICATPLAANAGTVLFDGFGGNITRYSNSGRDAWGNSWSLTQTSPGAGNMTTVTFSYSGTYSDSATYPQATDFEISFSGLTNLSTTASASSGQSVASWTQTYTLPSFEFAGAGVSSPDQFSFSVSLTGKIGSDGSSFAANWSTAVPEPSTWAMLGLGFAGLAVAGARARKKPPLAA